jgi:hypothetical protein
MAGELITSYGGWDYFEGGVAVDNSTGAYYLGGEQVWTPSAALPSLPDGWSGTLQGIAGKLADTWSAKTLMQQNQQGQRYREGQAGVLRPASGNSGLLMLLAAGALLFVLAK